MKTKVFKFVFLFIFVLIGLVAFIFNTKESKANVSEITTISNIHIAGVQVRTQGNAGLRFVGKINEGQEISDYEYYGIILAIGKADAGSMKHGGTFGDFEIKEYELKNDELDVDDGVDCVKFTIYGITQKYYGQNFTARMYARNGSDYVYSEEVVYRNLADASREVYNINDSHDNTGDLVETVANACRVKVTKNAGTVNETVNYYKNYIYPTDTTAVTNYDLKNQDTKNDIVELLRGTYNNKFYLFSGMKLYGANKDVEIGEDGTRGTSNVVGETILTQAILTSGSDIEANGLKLTGENSILVRNEHSKITFSYNKCEFSGISSIVQGKSSTGKDLTEQTHANIVIKNNYFYGSNANYTSDIELVGNTNGIEIVGNIFKNNLTRLSVTETTVDENTTYSYNDYAIYIGKPVEDSKITVENNKFRHYGANYLVLLGATLGSQTSYTAIIENNEISESNTKPIGGNAIGVYRQGGKDTAIVEIVKNSNFVTSGRFNAIVVSAYPFESISTTTTSLCPTVKILYNSFYHVAVESNPLPTSRSDSKYTRIGLRIKTKDDSSNIIASCNYIDSSTAMSTYFYKDNAVASAKSQSEATIENTSVSKDSYTTICYEMDKNIDVYKSEINAYCLKYGVTGLSDSLNAWYGGSDANDITRYIPSFASNYSDKLEIIGGELKCITTDAKSIYRKTSTVKSVDYSASKKASQEELYQAIETVAYAFYDKGNYIEYDETMNRRMTNATPEDATAYKHLILDCSSFVNSIYYNAFGRNILSDGRISTSDFASYAQINTSNLDVVKYIATSTLMTEEAKIENTGAVSSSIAYYYQSDEITKTLEYLENSLQIGDLLIYRKADAGHVMMYIGGGKFIHCTGASYNYDSDNVYNSYDRMTGGEKSDGAVKELNAINLFTLQTESVRYLFQEGIQSITLLRPIANDPTITETTNARIALGRMTIEATSDPSTMSTVSIDTEITYSIKIANKYGDNGVTKNKNLTWTAMIPEGTTYVFGSATATNDRYYDSEGNQILEVTEENASSVRKITWSLSQLSKTATRNFKVKVNAGLTTGTVITLDANVNGIRTNNVYHVVGDASNLTDLSSNMEVMTGQSKEQSSLKFIKEAYASIGVTVLDGQSLEDVLNSYMTFIDNQSGSYTIEGFEYANMVAKNLYGGHKFASQSAHINDNNRIRRVESKYLETGDIILTYDSRDGVINRYQAYLYIDSTHIYWVNSEGVVALKTSEMTVTPNSSVLGTSENKTAAQFLEQLEAYEYYLILRPSTQSK